MSQWGYDNQFFQNNRGCDFSIEALRKKHTGDPVWHESCEVAGLKRSYQNEIYKISENHQSHVSICHCRDCGIEFLTARSNAGRTDLRCPFGCRSEHRKQKSNKRSTHYYRSELGRQKKKSLNRRRSRKNNRPPSRPRHQDLQYYRWLVLVVERRRLCLSQLADLLAPIFEKVRQHSLEVPVEIDIIPDS